jgi:hypothetical protein
MKTQNRFSFFFLSFFLFFIACNKDNDCEGTVALTAILPNSGPPGTEVRVRGDGLTGNPEIRFAGQLAKSERTVEKGLTAIVPNNVTGLVDLTVEDGDCLVRTEFEVLGTLPANWVASPTIIVIPLTPSTFPQSIVNNWKNYYDNDHTIQFSNSSSNRCGDFVSGQVVFEENLAGSLENHLTNKFLKNNPVTGVYRCSGGSLDIIIDRTQNGGIMERLLGRIITASTIGESNNDGKTYMLLTSQTGRQYVFFVQF